MTRTTLLGIFQVVLALLIVSCENPFLRPDPDLESEIVLEIDRMPNVYSGQGRLLVYQAAYIEVEIYDGQIATPILKRRLSITEENGKLLARGSIAALPPRSQYLLWARAYEGNGTLWVEDSTQFQLRPGQRQTITLRLSPVASVIVPYPGPMGSLVPVIIPPRRTLIYSLNVASAGYYTVDAFDAMGSSPPQLEASFNNTVFKEYTPYLTAHRVVGGMAGPGQELVVAVGNAELLPRTVHLLVRLDGSSPPDGKTLAMNLDYVGTDFVVNDKVVVALEAFPVPMICTNISPTAVATHVATSEGIVHLDQLAQYGRNTWVLRFVHDINASRWFWGVLETSEDLASWHRSDRLNNVYLIHWTHVSSSAPAGPFPSLLPLDNAQAQLSLGGPLVNLSWSESAALSLDSQEPHNDVAGSAPTSSYMGPTFHHGYHDFSSTIHHQHDVDWVKFNPLPYSDRYTVVLLASDSTVPPLRLELFKDPDLTNPVVVLQHSPFKAQVSSSFAGQAGDQYYARVSSPWGAVGTATAYKIGFRLADEEEEPEEGSIVFLSLLDDWRQFRVSAANMDSFYFTNPYPNGFHFVAVFDWPSSTYPRRVFSDFPFTATWTGGNTESWIIYHAHPAVSKSFAFSETKQLSVTTPVIPGRRFRIKMQLGKDVDEPNEIHTASKILDSSNYGYYRSFHELSDQDWYRVGTAASPKRRYRVYTEPSDILPTLGVPTKFEFFNSAGTPIGGPYLKDAQGRTFGEITHTGQLKLQVLPDGALGAYRIRVNQRPDPSDRWAHWLFNNNLNPAYGAITLSGSGYEYVTGQTGAANSALRFDPSQDGKLQLSSVPPPPATYLVFNFWIYVEYMPGSDFSRGWVYAQEDAGGDLQFGIEIYQGASGLPRLRLHNGAAFKQAGFSLYYGYWNHVAVYLDGYTSLNKVGAFKDNIVIIPFNFWGADSPIMAATQAHIGGRAQAGTTLQGVVLDGFKIYNMGSLWYSIDYYGVNEDPK